MRQITPGLYARLQADTGIAALLRPDPDTGLPGIYEGWPEQELEEPRPTYFPRLTHTRPTVTPIADGVAAASVVIDAWIWPTGEMGGGDHADLLEAAVKKGLDQAVWHHDGARLHATVNVVTSEPSTGPEDPHRRMLSVSLLVSEE